MQISLSLLSFDGSLKQKIEKACRSPHDLIHIDYMDDIDLEYTIKELRKKNRKIDLHIVSSKPEAVINLLISRNLLDLLNYCFVQIENIDKKNLKNLFADSRVSPAIMVSTESSDFIKFLKMSDTILIMSSTPGKSGGVFNEKTYDVISSLKKINDKARLYIDGGVSEQNFTRLELENLHTAVIGTFLAKSKTIFLAYRQLKSNSNTHVTLKSLSEPTRNLPVCNSNNVLNVIEKMNEYKSNYALEFDFQNNFRGIITDGDLKRHIQEKQSLTKEDLISSNENFFYMKESDSLSDLLKHSKFRKELGCVPLISNEGKFESFVTLNAIWEK